MTFPGLCRWQVVELDTGSDALLFESYRLITEGLGGYAYFSSDSMGSKYLDCQNCSQHYKTKTKQGSVGYIYSEFESRIL